MQIQVHHLTDRATHMQRGEAMMGFNAPEHARSCAAFWVLGLYDHVATVTLPGVEPTNAAAYELSLEMAWRLTNSVDSPWYEGASQVANHFSGTGCRSTSVGDLMIMGTGPASRVWVVSGMGFTELTGMLSVEAKV